MSVIDISLLEQIRSLLEKQEPPAALLELTGDLQPYDLSNLLTNLDTAEQFLLLTALPPERSAETLGHFEPVEQYRFLDHLEQGVTAAILNQMSSDTVVELFSALHPLQTEQLIALLHEPFRRQIRDQMSYPENSAGSLATVGYIAARRWWTADQTLAHLRKVGSTTEFYSYIYILDHLGELVGVLSLRQLILADPPPGWRRSCPETNHCSRRAIGNRLPRWWRSDLTALPVISREGKMVGAYGR